MDGASIYLKADIQIRVNQEMRKIRREHKGQEVKKLNGWRLVVRNTGASLQFPFSIDGMQDIYSEAL